MPYLARQIETIQPWTNAFKSADPNTRILSSDMLLDWVSSDKRISVFELTDVEQEFERLALAFATSKKGSLPDTIAMVYVPREQVEAAGFVLDSSHLGKTCDDHINSRHLDILIPDAARAYALSEIFLRSALPKLVAKKAIQRLIPPALDRGEITITHSNFKLTDSATLGSVVSQFRDWLHEERCNNGSSGSSSLQPFRQPKRKKLINTSLRRFPW